MFNLKREEANYDVIVYLSEQVVKILRRRIQDIGGPTTPDPKLGEIEVVRLTTTNVSKLTRALNSICKALTEPPTCLISSTHERDHVLDGRELRLELDSEHLMDIRDKLATNTRQFASVRSGLNDPFTTRLPRTNFLLINEYALQRLVNEAWPPLLIRKIAIFDSDGNRVWDLDFKDKSEKSYYVPRNRSDKSARSHSKRNYAVLGLVVGGVGIIVTIIGGDVIRDWLMSLPGWIFSVFK